MTSPAISSTPRRRFVGLLGVLALAATAVFVAASPAHAHDELLSSDPAADSTVSEAPGAVTMTFSGALIAEPGATEVQVTDASGASLVEGDPTVVDNVLTQPLSADATGAVVVLWRVVSSDGHPISGEFSFTVAEAPATPDETATPTATSTTAPVDTATPSPTAPPSPETVPADGEAGATPWIVGGVIVLLAAAAAVYLVASRRRRSRAADGGGRQGSATPGGPGSGR